MDIAKVIRDAVASLPDGDYQRGLAAVVNHIDVAIAHLQSGQETRKSHLFTDAIYRCNQAFEGSVKEAYRVLAGKNPNNKTASQIESYLEEHSLLKPRVLEQLKIYRQDWRNPSTHDYTEDFDEAEAFLAIVNIVAFAKVCVDQIRQRITFVSTQRTISQNQPDPVEYADLVDTISFFIEQFFQTELEDLQRTFPEINEGDLEAGIAAMLAIIPDSKVEMQKLLGPGLLSQTADVYIECEGESAIVEIKSIKSSNSLGTAILQIDKKLNILPKSSGVIVIYDFDEKNYVTKELDSSVYGTRRIVVGPKTSGIQLIN